MTEYERDWHQEDKDDRAQGLDRDPESPDEEGQLLDLKVFAERAESLSALDLGRLSDDAITLREFLDFDVPALLERLRAVEEELADWRGRERRYEYTLTHNETPPSDPARTCSREQAENAWKRPVVGTPWVRTISTSDWRGHIEPPF